MVRPERDLAPAEDVEATLAANAAAVRRLRAGGLETVVREEGAGEPIVLLHGLPMSSFLYRGVISALAADGFRALSFDLPGLGLADRPVDFDYSLPALAQFAGSAVDALGLDRFHLVVHDAGGPVGFQLAMAQRDRVRSLTILNTMLDLSRTPYPGELLARVSDHVDERLVTPAAWRQMMYRVGIANRSAVSTVDIEVHRRLALGANRGASYLEIMRRIRTGHDAARLAEAVDTRRTPYPVQIVWGGLDPMLSLRKCGFPLLAASHVPAIAVLPAKHYPQEDHPVEVAALIARFAAAAP